MTCKFFRALVILLHGFAEHLDYYEELAVALVSRDLIVFGHDHYGFGRSEGVRASITDFNKFINDTVQHVNWLIAEYPDLPLFAVGHSMGGSIALKTLLKYPDFFHGIVLVSPGVVLSPEVITPIRLFLTKVFSRLVPQVPIGKMMYNIVTRDKQMVEKMKKDPLRYHSGIRTKFAAEFLSALQEICKNMSSIKCPFLTLHGDKDFVVDISSSQILVSQAGSKDKSLMVFENAYHGLLIELEDVKKKVVNDIICWIDDRLPSSHITKINPSDGGGYCEVTDCAQFTNKTSEHGPEITSKY